MSVFLGLLNSSCTIRRRNRTGSQDAWGHDTGEYTYQNQATNVQCRREGIGYDENLDNKELVEVTHRIFLPASTDIVQTDQVIIGSTTYDVMHVNDNPGAEGHHVEALLREIV